MVHNWLAILVICTFPYSNAETIKAHERCWFPCSIRFSVCEPTRQYCIPRACLVFNLSETLIPSFNCLKINKHQRSTLASRSVHLTFIVVGLTVCAIHWVPCCRAVWLTWLTFYVDVNIAPRSVHPFIRSTQQKLKATRRFSRRLIIVKGRWYINDGLACIVSSTVPYCLGKTTSAKVFGWEVLDSTHRALFHFNLAEGDIHVAWGG